MSKTVEKTVILSHETIGPQVKRMVLRAPAVAGGAKPGQFVHLRILDSCEPLLRRPISIADADPAAGTLTLIYRIVGKGTTLLAGLEPGKTVDVMGPLGSGFDLTAERPLLVGGGIGLAPMLYLAKALCPKPTELVMGGRNREELFWQTLFTDVCSELHVTTDDGSAGRKGFTVDLLPEVLASGRFYTVYACGPRPMLEGVARLAAAHGVKCQVSLEDHMACGVGACLSCTCASPKGGRRKVCTDGPVFWAEEVFEL